MHEFLSSAFCDLLGELIAFELPMAVQDQSVSSRKLAAILSADIAGYSALMGSDEEGTVRKLREVRYAVLPLIERFGGRVIDLAGDGVLAEFPSAVRAVESAAAVQSRMNELNAESDPPMLFRIAVNVGDVIHEGERLYGDGINVAARLQAIAAPGGICISNKVYEEVRDRVKLAFNDKGLKTSSAQNERYRPGPRCERFWRPS